MFAFVVAFGFRAFVGAAVRGRFGCWLLVFYVLVVGLRCLGQAGWLLRLDVDWSVG